MTGSKTIKYIAWLPIMVCAGLALTSPASAKSLKESLSQNLSHGAETRRDTVRVDRHRQERPRSRRHRGEYRRRASAPPAYRRTSRHREYRGRREYRGHRGYSRYRGHRDVRRRGHRVYGYGYHHADAYHWLAFTAITIKLLDAITVPQQRAYESAQIQATTAPVGETVQWNQGDARGTMTAVREGTSSEGRYCREFQQTIVVGGKTESAYGTACRQPDGSWKRLP